MTRILHVISGLGTGGAESFLVALASRLQQRGFEQHVVSVTAGGANAERLAASGIPVTELGVRGVLGAVRSHKRLGEIVARERPDVIQGWMYHGDLFATLMHALVGRAARLNWNIRCSDMRLEDYSLQLRMVVKACARLSHRPDVVIANSRAGGSVHVAAGYRPRRLEIIPNGIDTTRFRADRGHRAQVRAELMLGHFEPIIMHVARVDPMKDHLTLLEATETLRGATLILIGKGTEALALRQGVIGLGERGDVPRLLAAGDIIVSSSAYGEGFSNAIAEGMATGLLPIATDVGDAREIVGATGTIVPIRDAPALRKALDAALALAPPDRVERGTAARRRIEQNFSLERAVDRFAELYAGEAPAAT